MVFMLYQENTIYNIFKKRIIDNDNIKLYNKSDSSCVRLFITIKKFK